MKIILQQSKGKRPLVLLLKREMYIYFLSGKHKFHDEYKLYFISFATVHWIDFFVREEYMSIITDSRKFCQENKGREIYKLEGIVRDMNSYTEVVF